MAASIRAIEENYELHEKVNPSEVNFDGYKIENVNTQKGVIKLTLSIAYFIALVYFLFKLLA